MNDMYWNEEFQCYTGPKIFYLGRQHYKLEGKNIVGLTGSKYMTEDQIKVNTKKPTDLEKLKQAIGIQLNAPIPNLPARYTKLENHGYQLGWEDAMMRIQGALDTYDIEWEII